MAPDGASHKRYAVEGALIQKINENKELSLAFPMSATIGPYRVMVMHAPRSAMTFKRKMYQYDLLQGLVWLHESLEGKKPARYFLKAMAFIIHKAAGCH